MAGLNIKQIQPQKNLFHHAVTYVIKIEPGTEGVLTLEHDCELITLSISTSGGLLQQKADLIRDAVDAVPSAQLEDFVQKVCILNTSVCNQNNVSQHFYSSLTESLSRVCRRVVQH